VLGRDEAEPVAAAAAQQGALLDLPGALAWPPSALQALYHLWPSAAAVQAASAAAGSGGGGVGVLAFRAPTGQVLLPFHDPGPRGAFSGAAAASAVGEPAQGKSSRSSGSRNSSSRSGSGSSSSGDGEMVRRHAFALSGDPRFPWDADAAALAQVACACAAHVAELRRADDDAHAAREEAAAAARRRAAEESSDSD
jgi:hypothetical protein